MKPVSRKKRAARRAQRSLPELLQERGVRRNIWAVLKAVIFIVAVVAVNMVVFRALMFYTEDQTTSWLTAFYWVLTTMSTVGYGDVVFVSDAGRLFSVWVLITGIMLLFVVLPFTFLRFFYTPWLEAQIRKRTPRQVPASTRGHVVLCAYDEIARSLIERMEYERIPYFVIEPNQDVASQHYFAGISVVLGEVDNPQTYEDLRIDQARMVLANSTDTVNTNITLTVREVSEAVPIVAIAHQEGAVDILQDSGATRVLPLKRWLGEQLANRVNAAHTCLHVIGQFKDLMIAELPVQHTPLAGQTIRETGLREYTGMSIIGVWERGRLHPARPAHRLTEANVPVLVGTKEQLDELNYLFSIYDVNENPVLVVGGGIVGLAAARALQRKDIPAHIIEQDSALGSRLRLVCQEVFSGDATDPELLVQAGVREAPSVLLTTKDDALNIFLASLCRKLNPDLRIVSRIAHEHNIEAIHRAGADFVLGSASLGVETAHAILEGKEIVILGEGVDLFSMPLPARLDGTTLGASDIGARTGLNVIAVQHNGTFVTSPPPSMLLTEGAELLMVGDVQQRQLFADLFGSD